MRAIKGAVAAGIAVARVEVGKDGRIVVVTAKPGEPAVDDRGENEWDVIE